MVMTGCRLKFRARTAGCGCQSGAQSQNRESQRCNRVRIAVERLAKTNYSITKRNPPLPLPYSGELTSRRAQRTRLGPRYHEPPRNTRKDPESGP